jgi:hypothetical protein
MSKKTSEARKSAFFKALTETGNQSIAAEHAGVSAAWAKLHAARDPAFRARMRACREAAHGRLCGAEGMDPVALLGPEWACINGDPLVIRREKSGLVQLMRPPGYQFTPVLEARFLACLEETANVRLAHDRIGMTSKAVYDHRKRWPEFNRRWTEALERGRLRLEVGMIHAASTGLGDIGIALEQPGPAMTVAQAMHQLHRHKHAIYGIGRPSGLPPGAVDVDAVKAEILRKIAAMERAEKLGITGFTD